MKSIALPQPHTNLEVEFQSKLDLPRIVRSIAGRSDLAKAGTGEVPRSRDRNHAVTAEVWRIEVGVIKDVEEFSPEFQPEPLSQLHILENREIHSLERRSSDLVGRASECGDWAGQRSAGRRLTERVGVLEETQLSVGVDMQSTAQRLPWHDQIVAVRACGRRDGISRASEGNRLTSLEHHGRIDAPASKYLAGGPSASQVSLAVPEGKVILATEMEHISNIKRRQAIVVMDPKPWDSRSPIACVAATIQQVDRVCTRLGVSVGDEETQAHPRIAFRPWSAGHDSNYCPL